MAEIGGRRREELQDRAQGGETRRESREASPVKGADDIIRLRSLPTSCGYRDYAVSTLCRSLRSRSMALWSCRLASRELASESKTQTLGATCGVTPWLSVEIEPAIAGGRWRE